jgi:UDP-N-acetylglucosamine 2-epimerase (non-hydrolysing)
MAQNSDIGKHLGLTNGETWSRFALLTLHRPSNVDSTKKFAGLVRAITELASELPVVFPVHPRTEQQFVQAGFAHPQGLRVIKPLGYLDFLCLLSKATLVLTDSGGIQEETTVLGIPCLTLRENSERPITISNGTNELVGTSSERILSAARDILAGKRKIGSIPPLWDGKTSERIVKILLQHSLDR